MGAMLKVAAGLIFHEGKVLIGKRPKGKPYPGYWEFPGGKLEAGESAEDCLRRELREELGITAELGMLLTHSEYIYASGPVSIALFHVVRFLGELRSVEHEELRWARWDRLHSENLLPGNIDMLGKVDITDLPIFLR